MTPISSAIILINCPDGKGLVHLVTEFILCYKGNIISLEQHVDETDGAFFMRVEWDLCDFSLAKNEIASAFEKGVAARAHMTYSVYFSEEIPRMAIFVSKTSHCLFDILSRYQSQQWKVEIPLVVSNHPDLASVVENMGIPFLHIPVAGREKAEVEEEQFQKLKEYGINFIVLARYMQILSPTFTERFPNNIINIHHSFLPAFAGARPYHNAYERGVKIIGATSHYVTADLDAGPIIEQDTVHVRHSDSVSDLIRKGQDNEKVVLSRAIWHHINRKVLVYHNRTVIFS